MNPKNEWFKLGKAGRNFLFTYLLLLLLISLILSTIILLDVKEISARCNNLRVGLLSCLIFSVLGSSAFYIRKLYKACINLDIVEPESNPDKIRETGVIFYFVLRPVLSTVFALILFLSLVNLVNAFTESTTFTIDFIYISMFLSFFTGYSAGDVIDKFEKVGKDVVNANFNK